jgi:hypothetical protein
MNATLTKAEARHILFCIAGELLCDPYELLDLVPDLAKRIFNGEDYDTLLAYANENC